MGRTSAAASPATAVRTVRWPLRRLGESGSGPGRPSLGHRLDSLELGGPVLQERLDAFGLVLGSVHGLLGGALAA